MQFSFICWFYMAIWLGLLLTSFCVELKKSGGYVGEGKPGLQVAWNVYIASATRCSSCMGKIFFTATASYSPRISAPSLLEHQQPHTQFLFLAKPSKVPVPVRRTVVPALAGKAKRCFHFRSLVRPSCRTIASNFFLRRLGVLFISTCSLESPAMVLQDEMGGIRNENGTIPSSINSFADTSCSASRHPQKGCACPGWSTGKVQNM